MRLPPAALALALLAPPPLAQGQGAPGASPPPDSAERRIAVTVDDLPINGPDPGLPALRELNERLLAALGRQGVPAVGFVNESKLYKSGEVDGRVALLEAWLAQGLELGNHTFAHPSFNRVGLRTFLEDTWRGETVTRWLQEKRGQKMRWFRHPFLEAGGTAEDKAGFERALLARGYRVAPVTLDGWDWYYTYRYAVARRRDDRSLMARVATAYLEHCEAGLDYAEAFARRLFGRTIPLVFLMHENDLSADHFDRVAEAMKARGYRFVTLDEALADPAYGHADSFVGAGRNWLVRWALTGGMTEAELPPAPRPPAWLEELPADRSPYDPAARP